MYRKNLFLVLIYIPFNHFSISFEFVFPARTTCPIPYKNLQCLSTSSQQCKLSKPELNKIFSTNLLLITKIILPLPLQIIIYE